MKTNAAGLALIKSCEGLRLKAYPDPESERGRHLHATGHDDPALDGSPWTIGYGHTGPEVSEGLTLTAAQAERILQADVERFEAELAPLLGDVPLNENQYAACIVFAFNIGAAAFRGSTVLKRLRRLDFADAANWFAPWNKAGPPGQKKVSNILVTRRAAEKALFLKEP
jgi:lysozyme